MADPNLLAIVKDHGVRGWNEWRKENPQEIRANLSRADFRGAKLSRVNLSGADLSIAIFSGADLSNADLSGADLDEADLREVNLSGANLSGAILMGTQMGDADISGADLSRADLSEAKLSGAKLRGANLNGATLMGTQMCGVDLSGADLSEVDLSEANLSAAILGWTRLVNLDLSEVKGLETIKHAGPSTVGIDTIYKSGGKIPDIFLRGAGVPDSFIVYIGSLVGKPIEFYSCFISYSTKDQDFAQRLHADLQAKGVRCWFAPHDMAGGKKIYEQIDEAIRLYDRVLLILSRASMTSKWVKTEITKARRREEKERRRVLFPVRLVDFEVMLEWECFDADIGIDSAAEIREYFIPDFSKWKDHDSYQRGFQRLLRDLQSEADSRRFT